MLLWIGAIAITSITTRIVVVIVLSVVSVSLLIDVFHLTIVENVRNVLRRSPSLGFVPSSGFLPVPMLSDHYVRTANGFPDGAPQLLGQVESEPNEGDPGAPPKDVVGTGKRLERDIILHACEIALAWTGVLFWTVVTHLFWPVGVPSKPPSDQVIVKHPYQRISDHQQPFPAQSGMYVMRRGLERF